MIRSILTTILFITMIAQPAIAADKQELNDKSNINSIGFHKKTDLPPELQIKQIFEQYQKYSNNKQLEDFLSLHDDNYRSSDGYNKARLRELAIESWNEYPEIKYNLKVLNINVDVDNATVITQEKLIGTTNSPIELVKGNGLINSESTAIYYLKRCSNSWKIYSDFVISEKTSLRYGLAKYIPMSVDAPAIVAPDEDYTAILKINTPRQYVALISINNEPITYPIQKSEEVFRAMKSTGIQERILHSNDGGKNENAVASVGIAKPNIKNDNLSVDLLGIAFLSSRVNVVKHKSDNIAPINNTESEQ